MKVLLKLFIMIIWGGFMGVVYSNVNYIALAIRSIDWENLILVMWGGALLCFVIFNINLISEIVKQVEGAKK